MTDDLPGQMTSDRYTEIVTQRNELAAGNEALMRINTTLQTLVQCSESEKRRLEKEIRDLKATLSQSHANGGTWPV